MAAEAFNAVLTSLMQTSIEQLQDWVTQMYTGAHNFIFRTPESLTYSHDGVMGLWNSMRTLANAALMLVALWGGFNLMAGPHLDTPYHEAMELLPRLVVGALLVNTSGWWTRLVIDLNNALCLTLDITTLPGTEQLDTAENALILLFGSLVYVVMGVLLVLQNLLRLAMVAALIVLSPLSLLCWVLPQTQGRSRMWTSMYVNTVLTQFVQLLVLKLGTMLFLTGFLTGEGKVAALMGPVLGSLVLYVVLKVPKLMRSQMDSPLGMVRYVLVSQGVRTVTQGVSRAALGSR